MNSSDWRSSLAKLHHIKQNLISSGNLGIALQAARNFLDGFHYESLGSRLEEIATDYRLMRDFFRNGYRDDKRAELYDGLVCKLYRLINDIATDYRRVNDPQAQGHQTYRNIIVTDVDSVRQKLESYVTDLALSSLEPQESRQEKTRTIHTDHQQYMQQLFDAMIFSHQWTHEYATMMAELLVSPTVDSADAQLLVSAVMLGAILNKDPERIHALIECYERVTDSRIRQRALAGWVFALDKEVPILFSEISTHIEHLLDDERVRQEVMELQMQVVYCRNAKRDNDRLQQDIMPTLLKNQQFEITDLGMKPKTEDPIEDILHPEADEKKIEQLEESIRKMKDMRDQGVDIYFGGFSQMKRFSFFYTLCNWFMPFMPDHPQLSHLNADFLKSGMLKVILESGSFCDSDKYSFVLGTSAVFSKLPPNVTEMLNAGGDSFGFLGDTELDTTDQQYLRRMYLQDMYRFFTLCDMRQMFVNPYDDGKFLFLTLPIFAVKMGKEARKVQKMLLKQKMYNELNELFYTYKEIGNADDIRMEATIFMRMGKYMEAQAIYEQLRDMEPDNLKALSGFAYASFMMGEYHEAAGAYQELYKVQPDNRSVAQNLAISLIYSDKVEEGVTLLYRLEYENPDDQNIKRSLAWGQLMLGRTEQAHSLYQTIMASPQALATDYLNAGYCEWFSGNISEAVRLMRKSFERIEGFDGSPSTILRHFLQDIDLFHRYGISEVDQKIIADLVCEDWQL